MRHSDRCSWATLYFHDPRWTRPHPVFHLHTNSLLTHTHTTLHTFPTLSTASDFCWFFSEGFWLNWPGNTSDSLAWFRCCPLLVLLHRPDPSCSQPQGAPQRPEHSGNYDITNSTLALNPWWELELTVVWKNTQNLSLLTWPLMSSPHRTLPVAS